MRKILLSALLFVGLLGKAQISDFTTDSCYFSESLDIIHRNINNLECVEEFGYTLGDNELLIFGLRTINMGQHDAGIVNALDTTGLFFDECHYHYHIEDWNNVYLLNSCRDTVAKGAKVGYNLMDGGNVITAINVGYMTCFGEWIAQYGAIDYTLGVHPPNDDFNGDTRMGLSAGYLDTYPASTWGNSIKIGGVPNGVYTLPCVGNFSRYFNQGLNVFPDGFEVTVTISGVSPNRTISVGGQLESCCEPQSCVATDSVFINRNKVITWNKIQDNPCDSSFIVTRYIARTFKSRVEARVDAFYSVTGYSFYDYMALDYRTLQQKAKRIPDWGNNGEFTYFYSVKTACGMEVYSDYNSY